METEEMKGDVDRYRDATDPVRRFVGECRRGWDGSEDIPPYETGVYFGTNRPSHTSWTKIVQGKRCVKASALHSCFQAQCATDGQDSRFAWGPNKFYASIRQCKGVDVQRSDGMWYSGVPIWNLTCWKQWVETSWPRVLCGNHSSYSSGGR